MAPIPTVVVGGGIGGLAAALAIARRGRPVHVLERAREFSELGAGLQLAPNATRMLARLGILDEVLARAVRPGKLVTRDALTGETIRIRDLGPSFVARYGYPYVVAFRGDLLNAELEACERVGVMLETHKEVVSVRDCGDTAVAVCADGSTYEAETLVGADGLWSLTRKVVCDDGPPICSESVAYRGTVPLTDQPELAETDDVTIWVGHDLHFVQYRMRRGELLNHVAVFRSDRYQRGHDTRDDWGTPDELDARFGGLCAAVRAGLRHINTKRRWPLFDRLPIPTWSRNRITLLGDAAHPMLQYAAQGACQAIEDAVCLGDCLAQEGNPTRALVAYQEKRMFRVARVQQRARLLAGLYHSGTGIGTTLREAIQTQSAADDRSYFEWLYSTPVPDEL